MRKRQLSLFEAERLDLQGAIETSLASLAEYGRRYRHWALAFSGGKDSTATATFVAWAIKTGLVEAPQSLTILYADTRMELTPLQQTAMALMTTLAGDGFQTQVVLPPLDDRFYVYMLGRGVPPPKNRFRWCTPQLKIYPMQFALEDRAAASGFGEIVETNKSRYRREYRGFGEEKLLMLTGVRMGESAARDQRIAVSCAKDSGECGQGWFQVATPESLADTLAPLLHWRLCHVYDWLYFEQDRHGYDVSDIALIYGDDEVRTGCVGCNLASRDVALERLVRKPGWEHLSPLLELKPLYKELTLPRWRKRKAQAERRKDGAWGKNPQRMGPLTMAGRAYGLERVLDIQARAGVDLINAEEEGRIREMWAADVWPQKWSADDIDATVSVDAIRLDDRGELVKQQLLVSLEGVGDATD